VAHRRYELVLQNLQPKTLADIGNHAEHQDAE
jgi:hypothetical protein